MDAHSLQRCGNPKTHVERAWRLSEALKEPALINPASSASFQSKMKQVLLEYADVFCINKGDLKTPALAEPMHLDTGDAKPIKQRAYKLGRTEQGIMDKEVAG